MNTTVQRRSMRDRVHIGQAWRRRRTGEIGVIHQIHRADRQVELLGIEGVRCVSFTDLRRLYEEVTR